MTRWDIDEAVRAKAGEQHGVFTRAQARAFGATSDMVSRRVRSGHWSRAAPGVYILAGTPSSWWQRLKAAELSVPGSAISHCSALELHGIPGGHMNRIDLTVGPSGPRRTRLALVHRSTTAATTRVKGLHVVTPVQAVIDTAGSSTFGQLERRVDHVLLSGLAPLRRFQDRVTHPDAAPFPGLASLRPLIIERGEGFVVPASELERKLYRLLDLAGVPGLVRQATPPWDPASRRRFDALSAAWMTIYEGDGRLWHTRMRAMERDRRRDQEAAANGFLTLRFTWSQLTVAVDEAIAVIRRAGRWRSAA